MASLKEQIALPGIAGGMAVCFTHPLELTKTRLQLDNERAARGTPRQYTGWLNCVKQNYTADGIRGLQRGLGLGIVREICFNSVRIGLFEPVLGGIHSSLLHFKGGDEPPTGVERMAAGMACGALGGCCVNPIEVLKVRMQAQGGMTGFQHGYSSAGAAMVDLVRTEGL